MDIVSDYFANFEWESVIVTALRITLILVFAWVAMVVLQRFLNRLKSRLLKNSQSEGEPPSETEKRVETIVRLLRQGALIGIWTTVSLVALREIGLEIAPIIASAGIIGLAVGFGAQNLVRDVIAGFFFILENQVRVGDVAVVNGTGGLVERINFRTIVLRDLGGTVHIFPNGTVNTMSNLTSQWSAYIFDIGVAYKEDTDRVIELMKEVGKEMYEDPAFKSKMLDVPEIFGVDKFADSAVIIKGRVRTKPIQQWAVGREFLRRVKYAFDENGIEIPFPHRTLYIGQETKPLDLKILEKFPQGVSAPGS